MKHVSILALYDATLTSIDSSHQLFNRANDFMRYQGKPQFYSVEIVGVSKNVEFGNGLYTIRADKTINEVK
ncbi:MAG: AraC family transcriptional regulator, partial [Mucilaginibacter sp.]